MALSFARCLFKTSERAVNTEIIKIILAFLVLINPFSALTLFLDLTRGYSMMNRRKVARIACLTIFITISFFTVVGETLLKALGISIGSFQLAGGILVFLIALNMMNGEGNPVKPDQENFDVDHVQDAPPTTAAAVVPLAIPMMIGPGGISTVIIYSSQVSGILQISAILIAGLLISIFCYLALMAAGRISRLLGDTGLNIMSRIMGMLLAAVSIEIIVNALRSLFPVLL
jgi:multiple antibiotic resistance protein|nr:MarC family protein [Psychrobacter sp. Ps3]